MSVCLFVCVYVHLFACACTRIGHGIGGYLSISGRQYTANVWTLPGYSTCCGVPDPPCLSENSVILVNIMLTLVNQSV